ncbi:MAG: chemotaxis response regulator protein-glutamate methylesterase [Armatimonadia bacterium]
MIRVLVVDDSAIVRRVLSEQLNALDDVEVVGTAVDPYVARDRIMQLKPDVMTLDVEMPRLDGLSFLATLMRHHPIPVVIVSSLTPRNSDTALRALALGAVEVVPKPGSSYSVPDVGRELARAVRVAARAKLRPQAETEAGPELLPSTGLLTTHKVIAIGASTGGTTAIEDVLRRLPRTTPGIVIVQHMPEYFTGPFAKRLNQFCEMEIREGEDGDPVVPGVAIVARGARHMVLQRSGAKYVVRIKDGPPVHHQKPAVDPLFESVAQACGPNAVGALLTGMGADGARGLLSMREAGAQTIAQDEATCVVFGMPREAIKLGAAQEVVPLPNIAQRILTSLGSEAGKPAAKH